MPPKIETTAESLAAARAELEKMTDQAPEGNELAAFFAENKKLIQTLLDRGHKRQAICDVLEKHGIKITTATFRKYIGGKKYGPRKPRDAKEQASSKTPQTDTE
jgi:hypothetical protein